MGMMDKQIEKLYLEKKLEPEQIAEGLGVELGQVIFAISNLPKRKTDNTIKADISKHASAAVDIIAEIMQDEDQSGRTRLDASKFVCEVAMGKHDVVKDQSSISISNLNLIMQAGREKHAEISAQVPDLPIEEIITTESQFK